MLLLVCFFLFILNNQINIIEASLPQIIYGNDTRMDIWNMTMDIQDLTRKSIVALIPKENLYCSQETGICTTSGPRFGFEKQLCSNERFFNQTLVSDCSGTLIGPDRIATAGHCVSDSYECESKYIVFNYFYKSETTLETIYKAKDVYTCKQYFTELTTDNKDWAVIQLDRQVDSSHSPVEIAEPYVPKANDSIIIIGFPDGLPAKGDLSGVVTGTVDWGFYAVLNSFGGNSGSGIFRKSDLKQIGILARGNEDFRKDETENCMRPVRAVTSDFEWNEFEQCSYIWKLTSQIPSCKTNSDCASNITCAITSGLSDGFCLPPSNICPKECDQIQSSCCFKGDSNYGACNTCGYGACSMESNYDHCITCEEGYEVDVQYDDCTGYCVPVGKSTRLPSIDICPEQLPLPDCCVDACGDKYDNIQFCPVDPVSSTKNYYYSFSLFFTIFMSFIFII